MKTNLKLCLSVVGLCSLFMTAGCIDSNYDASQDIDMTVAVGKGVSVPFGSTEKISMDEMLDIENSASLKVDANGNYYFYKAEPIDATSYSVDPFTFNYSCDDVENDYKFTCETTVSNPVANVKYPFHIFTTVDETSYIKTKETDTTPKEVRELYTLVTLEGGQLNISVSMLVVGDVGSLASLNLGNATSPFYADFPSYIKFDKSGGNIIETGSAERVNFTGEKLVNKGAQGNGYLFQLTKSLTISSFLFPEGKLKWDNNTERHPVLLNDPIKTHGIVWCDNVMLTSAQAQNITGHFSERIDPLVITIDEFTGRVDPVVDPINQTEALDLSDDMDFLKEDGVSLTLTNPIIYMDINNPADVPMTTAVTLNGQLVQDYTARTVDGSEVNFNITLPKKGVNRFIISALGTTADNYTAVKVPTLANLFKVVPDNIVFHLEPAAVWNSSATPHHVVCGRIVLDGNYTVNVPLKFNNFKFTYTETMDKVFGDDPTETTDQLKNIDKVTMTISAQNTTPMVMDLAVKAYKDDGRTELPNVKAVVDKKIAAGNGYNNAAVATDITITLTASDNQLVDLSTIKLLITGTGSGQFNEKDYLILNNMKIKINDAIILDLNDDNDNE